MKVLFVCLGNICRSPMAEAILRHKVEQNGLHGSVEVDSAGTGSWHEGEDADPRTLATLRKNGIPYAGRARQVTPKDIAEFDLILTMDSQNLADVKLMAGANDKVKRFLNRDVPDPYYVGEDGFDEVFEMLDEGCDELLMILQAEAGFD